MKHPAGKIENPAVHINAFFTFFFLCKWLLSAKIRIQPTEINGDLGKSGFVSKTLKTRKPKKIDYWPLPLSVKLADVKAYFKCRGKLYKMIRRNIWHRFSLTENLINNHKKIKCSSHLVRNLYTVLYYTVNSFSFLIALFWDWWLSW